MNNQTHLSVLHSCIKGGGGGDVKDVEERNNQGPSALEIFVVNPSFVIWMKVEKIFSKKSVSQGRNDRKHWHCYIVSILGDFL